MVSAAFGNCPPSVAEAELLRDPGLVYGIMDYRNAQAVLDVMKRGDEGAKVIADNPEMMQIIERLHAAQMSFEDWTEYLMNERRAARKREEAFGHE